MRFLDRTVTAEELLAREEREDVGIYREIRSVARRFVKNRMAVVGLIVAFLLVAMAIAAPLIAPYDPDEVHFAAAHKPMSREYLLGTDEFGRDVLSRLIYAARVSLTVGVGAVTIALILGGSLGLIAGYYGGRVDYLITSMLDVVWAFPPTLLAIALIAVRGPSVLAVLVIIGVVTAPGHLRIIRGQTLSVRSRDYIMAARATGIRAPKILLTHIFPNVMGPVLVLTTMGLALAISIEATLSFLGLGVQPPTSSWGLMLNGARRFIRTYPMLSIFPGVMIMLAVLSFNALGDGLRDALDPKLKTT